MVSPVGFFAVQPQQDSDAPSTPPPSPIPSPTPELEPETEPFTFDILNAHVGYAGGYFNGDWHNGAGVSLSVGIAKGGIGMSGHLSRILLDDQELIYTSANFGPYAVWRFGAGIFRLGALWGYGAVEERKSGGLFDKDDVEIPADKVYGAFSLGGDARLGITRNNTLDIAGFYARTEILPFSIITVGAYICLPLLFASGR